MPSKTLTHLLPEWKHIEPYDPNKMFNASWKQLLNPFKLFSLKILRYRSFKERCVDLIQFCFGSNSNVNNTPDGTNPLSYQFEGQGIYYSLAGSPFPFENKEAVSALSISDYLSLGIFPALTYLINRLVDKIFSSVSSPKTKYILHTVFVAIFLFPVLFTKVALNFILFLISFPIVCFVHLLLSLFHNKIKKESPKTTEEIIVDAEATHPGHLITCHYTSYQDFKQYLKLILASPQQAESYKINHIITRILHDVFITQNEEIRKALIAFILAQIAAKQLKEPIENLLAILPRSSIVVLQEDTPPLGYYYNPRITAQISDQPLTNRNLLTEISLEDNEHLFFSSKNNNKNCKYLIHRIKTGGIKANSQLLDKLARAEAIDNLAETMPPTVIPEDAFLNHVCPFL